MDMKDESNDGFELLLLIDESSWFSENRLYLLRLNFLNLFFKKSNYDQSVIAYERNEDRMFRSARLFSILNLYLWVIDWNNLG